MFPNTPILDTFIRANENPLSNGGKWTLGWDASPDPMQILSNQAVATVAGAGAYWNVQTFGPDCEVYATLNTIPSVNNQAVLALRITTPGNNMSAYAVRVDRFDNTIKIFKYVNGSGPVESWSQAATLSNGDSFGMSAIDNILTVYTKAGAGAWTQLFQVVDNSSPLLTAGYISVEGEDTTAGFINFGGGTLLPVSIGSPAPDTEYIWFNGDE